MKHWNIHQMLVRMVILQISLLFLSISAYATVTYVPAGSLNFTKNSPYHGYFGALGGTVFFIDEPQNSLDFIINTTDMGSPFSVSYVFVDPATGEIRDTATTPSKLYIAYHKITGSGSQPATVVSSNLGAVNILGLDTNYPVQIYLLIQNGNFNPVMNTSNGSLYYVETDTGFSVVDDEGNNLLIIGGDASQEESVPILGGGIPGPDGEGSIIVGDTDTNTPVVELPLYQIQFSEPAVTIDLDQAYLSPVPLTNIQLTISNISTAFFGNELVKVRFYQEGYDDFYLLHDTYPGFRIPFSLWWMNTSEQIHSYLDYSPWGTTIQGTNSSQIGFSLVDDSYLNAIAGTYSATITIEVFSGY